MDKPLFDLSTFSGRFEYYAWMTDPRTVILSSDRLLQAKSMIENYRQGKQSPQVKPEEVHYNMKLYSSAFHPDTGELQNFCGRMSFQASLVMVIGTWIPKIEASGEAFVNGLPKI